MKTDRWTQKQYVYLVPYKNKYMCHIEINTARYSVLLNKLLSAHFACVFLSLFVMII